MKIMVEGIDLTDNMNITKNLAIMRSAGKIRISRIPKSKDSEE